MKRHIFSKLGNAIFYFFESSKEKINKAFKSLTKENKIDKKDPEVSEIKYKQIVKEIKMANEYPWPKPVISVEDIDSILFNQYGEKNYTRIMMEDTAKNIQYKSSILKCECLRCGKQFSLSPYAIVNSVYTQGFVCSHCGMMTNEEVTAEKNELRRIRAIEVLKEYGIDVVKEAIEDKEVDKDFKEDVETSQNEESILTKEDIGDENVDYTDASELSAEELSAMEGDYPEAESDINERETVPTEVKSQENAIPSIEENSEKSVTTVNDDKTDKNDEIIDNNEKSEIQNADKIDIINSEKTIAEDDNMSKHDKYSEYMVKDDSDDDRMSIREMLGDNVPDDIPENDVSDEEVPIEEEVEEENMDENSQLSPVDEAMEDLMSNDEKENTSEEINPEESSESVVSENVETEESEIKEDGDTELSEEDYNEEEINSEDDSEINGYVVGETTYNSEDELSEALSDNTSKAKEILGIQPWDIYSCDVADGYLTIKCKTCNNVVKFEAFEDLAEIKPLDEILKQYGIEYDEDRCNNIDHSTPLISKCPVCIESIIKNGYNTYRKASIERMAHKSHFTVKNLNNHYFCRTREESYIVCANDITHEMKFVDMVAQFGKGQDARLVEPFSITKSNKENENDNEANKTNNKFRVVNAKIPVTPKKEAVFTKSENVNNNTTQNTQEKPKSVFTLKKDKSENFVGNTSINNSNRSEERANSSNTKSSSVFKKMDKQNGAFSGKNTIDTLGEIEKERQFEQDKINSQNIFKPGKNFNAVKKEIASLDGKVNPFERQTSLVQEFTNSVFKQFVDELVDKTGVQYKFLCDNTTYEIPIVDFESGLRIICSDVSDASLANVDYSWINPRVPFSWFESDDKVERDAITGKPLKKQKQRKKYHWNVLFSDSIVYSRDAMFCAIVKYINPDILPYGKKKIQLQDNLIFQYTNHPQYLTDFDKRYSPYPSKKPSTGRLGIIARWAGEEESTTRDVLRWKLQMETGGNNSVTNLDTLATDYDEYMVASIKYIEEVNKQTNRVTYIITEYVEVDSALIVDGFAQCLRALLKEYMIKYPTMQGITPYIIVEIDPSEFPSPTLKNYIEKGTLVKETPVFRSMRTGGQLTQSGVPKFLRNCYIRRPEYRGKSEYDYMRQDMRMFQIGTLISRMKDEIQRMGLSNTIRNPEVRKAFISNMGYVEAKIPEVKSYFVNQSIVMSMMCDGVTLNLTKKIDDDGFFQKTRVVTDSMNGIGINNIMMNPLAAMRYQKIMERGTPEAKQYFQRMMYEDQQTMYNEQAIKMQQEMMNGFQNGMSYGDPNVVAKMTKRM